jgi:hypothetical protein
MHDRFAFDDEGPSSRGPGPKHLDYHCAFGVNAANWLSREQGPLHQRDGRPLRASALVIVTAWDASVGR